MKSNFNKETSDGVLTFDTKEVFEALTMWCEKRGIFLKDRNVLDFSCSGEPDYFEVNISFNDKK